MSKLINISEPHLNDEHLNANLSAHVVEECTLDQYKRMLNTLIKNGQHASMPDLHFNYPIEDFAMYNNAPIWKAMLDHIQECWRTDQDVYPSSEQWAARCSMLKKSTGLLKLFHFIVFSTSNNLMPASFYSLYNSMYMKKRSRPDSSSYEAELDAQASGSQKKPVRLPYNDEEVASSDKIRAVATDTPRSTDTRNDANLQARKVDAIEAVLQSGHVPPNSNLADEPEIAITGVLHNRKTHIGQLKAKLKTKAKFAKLAGNYIEVSSSDEEHAVHAASANNELEPGIHIIID